MRITNNMMVQTMLNNLNRNATRLNQAQTQYATGKRINKPSDDPRGIAKSMRLRSDISAMEQYERNVNDAYSFMDTTETAIRNMQQEGMNRIRELTVQASSETLTQDETIKIQAEIEEIRQQMIDMANYTYSGKHIFSGTKTNQPLLDSQGYYQMDLVKYENPAMNDDVWNFETSTREKIQVNTLGFEVFEAESNEIVRAEVVAGEDTTIELPYVDGSGKMELTIRDGDDSEPTKEADGNWTVGAGWQGSLEDSVTEAMKEIKAIEGERIIDYQFEVADYRQSSYDGTAITSEEINYLKAVPVNGVIEDTFETQAAWSLAEDQFSTPNFANGTPQSFSFGGAEVVLVQGDPDADPAEVVIPEELASKDKIVLTVHGDPDDISEEDYMESYAEALNKLSDQRGSQVQGFAFVGDADGLKAIAPKKSDTLHNKKFFSGSLLPVDPTDREAFKKDQLVVAGKGKHQYIVEGQRAGLFQLLDDLEKNMLDGNQEALSNMLGDIDAHMDSMLTARSSTGARANRTELILYRIEDDVLNFRELMSKIEDADMAEVSMNLMNEENVYRASLNVGARVIQPSLLDFLR
ncbi:flagellar hook-associated protein FlgL [Tindallia californiensis]|uniref:Flagellar hook-associated protein 3 n=1 Tax=Tindallia californiensis TaxID=159292 RepID=A0A1H3LBQ2_9FIRM|nr:flagellar hook-associated protein FlgL [Tindallia californiensis]SDY62007.1 flagellar hook-associated protein 3 [Tindallia californiensis]